MADRVGHASDKAERWMGGGGAGRFSTADLM